MYLFIDTTQFITLGLLDSELNWVSFKLIEDKKSSATLHFLVDDLLSTKKIEFSELAGIIYMAGPGSYTGMRVSQGFVDICRLEGMPIYSLYHYQVPALSKKFDKGIW